jgi:hypothetical protein
MAMLSFAQFHQNTVGAFRVQKCDFCATGAHPGLFVDQTNALFL